MAQRPPLFSRVRQRGLFGGAGASRWLSAPAVAPSPAHVLPSAISGAVPKASAWQGSRHCGSPGREQASQSPPRIRIPTSFLLHALIRAALPPRPRPQHPDAFASPSGNSARRSFHVAKAPQHEHLTPLPPFASPRPPLPRLAPTSLRLPPPFLSCPSALVAPSCHLQARALATSWVTSSLAVSRFLRVGSLESGHLSF